MEPHVPTSKRLYRTQLCRAIAILTTVVSSGTIGFMTIEGWSVWKSLYFTMVTITTVGYGDEGISDGGRIFATVLLIGGIATASYAVAFLVQATVAQTMDWRSRVQEKVDRVSEHTIVCGFGRMGRTVCEQLAQHGRKVVVVDKSVEHVQEAIELGYLAVLGPSTEDETLERAGIDRALHLVAAMGSPEANIVTSLTARGLSPTIRIIARAEHPPEVRKLERAGADRTVSPFQSGGVEAATAIVRPKVADFLADSISAGHVVLGDIRIQAGSPLDGQTLAEYGKSTASRVSFVSVEREGEAPIIPAKGAHRLAPGDHLIVAGDPGEVRQMQMDGCAAPLRGSKLVQDAPAETA